MVRISVDLPQPLGPRMATCSPARMVRFDVVEDDAIAAGDVDIPQLEKLIRIKRQLGFGWVIG